MGAALSHKPDFSYTIPLNFCGETVGILCIKPRGNTRRGHYLLLLQLTGDAGVTQGVWLFVRENNNDAVGRDVDLGRISAVWSGAQF